MKYLAILGSNQDANRYSNSTLTEYVVLQQIANACEDYARAFSGVIVRAIKAMPQSKDAYSLQGLYRQISDAVSWLQSVMADPKDAAMLNLHSDSGTFSHIFGIYGGGKNSPSYNLSRAVVTSVEGLMKTGDTRYLDYSAYAFYRLRGPYNTALIELGSHQNAEDIKVLVNRQDELAKAVVDGAISYLGVDIPVNQPVDDYAAYFSQFGVPYNPDAALARYWRACRDLGDIANLGPAISGEMDGTPYSEPGHIVQKFANAILVCHPEDGWKVYRAQVVVNPKQWFPELA